MGGGSVTRCAWRPRLIAFLSMSVVLLVACSSGDDDSGEPAPCSPGAAACGAAATGGAGSTAGGGAGAASGSSGAGGVQATAGSGAGGAAGAGIGGAGAAAGSAGSAGMAGGTADAGATQDAAVADAGENESDAGTDAATGDDAGTVAPPYTPVYRLAARIHAGDSTLSDEQFIAITAEVNQIWRSQAGVCFEFELVDHDDLGPGFDIWYNPGTASDPNGYYSGDNDIFSRDQPSLGPAPHPGQLPTARTTAHEFGHALGLPHQDFENACPDGNGDLDCNDLLMRSGRRGFFLSDPEIERARSVAENKALDDSAPLDCAALVIAR